LWDALCDSNGRDADQRRPAEVVAAIALLDALEEIELDAILTILEGEKK
jgi:hypothetical protein